MNFSNGGRPTMGSGTVERILRVAAAAATTGLVVLTGCGGNEKRPVTVDTSRQGVDYMALQRRAEAFVPTAGPRGGRITLPLTSEPASFNPIVSVDPTTALLAGHQYLGLTRISGVTSMPEPCLAESWQVSRDGTKYSFRLRRDVMWSDSVPFSAHDVVFTYRDLILGEKSSAAREQFIFGGKPTAVEAEDSFRVCFVLPEPFAPFLRALSREVLPRHTYESSFRAGTFGKALGVTTPLDSMVGTGPFILTDYRPGRSVTFRRNPLYWLPDSAGGRLPFLDTVAYRILPAEDAVRKAFRGGEIDYLVAHGEDYEDLVKRSSKDGYVVYRLGPALGSNFLCFNQNADETAGSVVPPVKLGWFRNVLFRRAVSHAIGRRAMIASVTANMGYPQWSPMTPAEGPFFNPDVATCVHNLDSARALLAMAGLTDSDSDGVVEDSAATRCEITLLTNQGNAVRRAIAESIRDALDSVGIAVRVDLVPFEELIRRTDNPPYAWEAVLMGLSGTDDPHFARAVWVSSGSQHMWRPRQERPATEWEARIDSLFAAGVRETDPRKRRDIYHQWQRIAADQLPLIYTILPERILCISDKFLNVNPSVKGGLLHNIDWIRVNR